MIRKIVSVVLYILYYTLIVLLWQGQAALHALGNISGETRSENSMILTSDAEESLRRLIYETASKSSKLTPSVSSFFLPYFFTS